MTSSPTPAVHVNGRSYQLPRTPTVVVCVDGCEPDYLAQAVASLGHVAEGVYCARTVVQRARALGVDMPIAQAVVALLDGQLGATQAVASLMGRDPTAELG
jgi:glycerol-3-phosphate dehydrogenase